MSTNTRPPQGEVGTVVQAWTTLPGLSMLAQDGDEYVPDLRWPRAVRTYERMRNDAQIAGLMLGLTAPIMRYRWHVDPNGAPPATVERIAEDLGLPILGRDAPKRRRGGRFSFKEHLRWALHALEYGHAYFEQVGVVEGGVWRLRKLAPRPQSTITGFDVAGDGGLIAIEQNAATGTATRQTIPVGRLVAYVWDRDPGQWWGRSMLRPLYRNWLLKDRLVRVDVLGQERMLRGTPVVTPPAGATDAQMNRLQEMADALAAGEADAAVTVPGAELSFHAVRGGQAGSAIASARYHDEQMARGLLMMFMQLGQTETGSRALGESMVDYVALAQEAVAGWVADVVNEHVIEDAVDWNEGPEAPAPIVTFDPGDPGMAVDELVALIAAGAVRVDDELESWLRDRGGLPAGGAPRAVAARAGRAASRGREPVRAAATLPDRPLRREPFEHELRAAVDFRALEAVHVDGTAALVAQWEEDRAAVHAALIDAAEAAAGDVLLLARLAVPAAALPDPAPYAAALVDAARAGAELAAAEAREQGVEVPDVDLDAIEEEAAARAEAVLMLLVADAEQSGRRRAVELAGEAPLRARTKLRAALRGPALARALGLHFEGVTAAGAQYEWGAAITRAANEGRTVTMQAAAEEAEGVTYYASELLDGNTCDECAGWDGHEFATLAEAEAQYPGGQNVDCEGRARCRGTLVAEYTP